MASAKEVRAVKDYIGIKSSSLDSIIGIHIDTARIIVRSEVGRGPNFSLLLALQACHSLWQAGIIKTLTSESIGDISQSFDSVHNGKTTSVFLTEYKRLLGSQEPLIA